MKRAKQLVLTGLVALGLLLIAAFVMNNLAPSPVAAAKRHCIEQGWNEGALLLIDYHSSAKLGGSKATVHFSLNDSNRNQTIQVELRKGVFDTKWNIEDFSLPDDQDHKGSE